MKTLGLLLSVAVLAALAVGVMVFTSRRDPSPKSVTRPTLDSLINVHGSPEQGLRICGKTFRRVRGGPPYYITVPTTPLVLFAYEPFPGARTLVVCNTNDCTFREIPLGNAVFGDQIGYCAATKGQMGDTVESMSSNHVMLLSKGFRYLERSLLDLDKDTILVVEVQSEHKQIPFDFLTNQQPRSPLH
ncbi:MAG TPA: hypothetical protein PLW35_11480 [Verrucomicrobiota bacterium]|nr:hypothetical protein [Verrucomicrobiota bacterium]